EDARKAFELVHARQRIERSSDVRTPPRHRELARRATTASEVEPHRGEPARSERARETCVPLVLGVGRAAPRYPVTEQHRRSRRIGNDQLAFEGEVVRA